MIRPRLLDLFCGGGGASTGYARAGFEVVGVDIAPMRDYPFAFVQADALAFLDAGGAEGFDAVHASPPCQAYSQAGFSHRGGRKSHPDLVPGTRARLEATGLPWVIENVVGAPIRADLMLCGTMFGLEVRRHRLFESNIDLGWPEFACACRGLAARGRLLNVHSTRHRGRYRERVTTDRYLTVGALMSRAYGIDYHMREEQLYEAIPPAYTELVGTRLLEHLARVA